MNKIILIFLEDSDFCQKVEKILLKKIKKFLIKKRKKGFQIRIFSTKNETEIKKWLIKCSLDEVISNAKPFNSTDTIIDENIEIFSFFDFSKVFEQ